MYNKNIIFILGGYFRPLSYIVLSLNNKEIILWTMESVIYRYIPPGLLPSGYRLPGLEYGYCRMRRLNPILLSFLLSVTNCTVNSFWVVLKDRRLGKSAEDRIVPHNPPGGNPGISLALSTRGPTAWEEAQGFKDSLLFMLYVVSVT